MAKDFLKTVPVRRGRRGLVGCFLLGPGGGWVRLLGPLAREGLFYPGLGTFRPWDPKRIPPKTFEFGKFNFAGGFHRFRCYTLRIPMAILNSLFVSAMSDPFDGQARFLGYLRLRPDPPHGPVDPTDLDDALAAAALPVDAAGRPPPPAAAANPLRAAAAAANFTHELCADPRYVGRRPGDPQPEDGTDATPLPPNSFTRGLPGTHSARTHPTASPFNPSMDGGTLPPPTTAFNTPYPTARFPQHGLPGCHVRSAGGGA